MCSVFNIVGSIVGAIVGVIVGVMVGIIVGVVVGVCLRPCVRLNMGDNWGAVGVTAVVGVGTRGMTEIVVDIEMGTLTGTDAIITVVGAATCVEKIGGRIKIGPVGADIGNLTGAVGAVIGLVGTTAAVVGTIAGVVRAIGLSGVDGEGRGSTNDGKAGAAIATGDSIRVNDIVLSANILPAESCATTRIPFNPGVVK